MVLKNFAVIQGDCTCNNGIINYTEAKTNEEGTKIRKLPAIVRSSECFSNGKISFSVKLTSTHSGYICVLKTVDNRDLYIGFNRILHSYFIRYADESNEKCLASAGTLENVSLDSFFNINIEVLGSKINLFVNNVLICNADVSLKEAPIEFHINGQNEVTIKDVSIDKEQKSVFVVMQFTQEYNDLYEQVIIPVISKYNMNCIRADDIYTATPILADIINEIKAASIVIADITPDNPNVFYELGFAHALNKPTIVLSEKQRTKLPFDVSGLRTIFYDNSIAGKAKVEQTLTKFIEKIIKA